MCFRTAQTSGLGPKHHAARFPNGAPAGRRFSSATVPAVQPPLVPFRDALRVWVRVALQSFGGPAGQISVMDRILVDEKRWIDEPRFLHALNYCMLLPGPEAQQLAIYIGWMLHGTAGGLAAGILFVLPGFLAILGLSLLYVGFLGTALVAALLWGLKPAVIAVVLEAVLRIGRRALGSPFRVALAVASFLAIFLFAVPFPAIVLAAALLGWLGGRFTAPQAEAAASARPSSGALAGEEGLPRRTRRERTLRSLRVLAIGLALWFVPLGLLAIYFGRGHVLVQMGLFFSRAAVVTFGGAYAVLAYVGQQAVETFGWLRPGEMLDGLGMAETTPGPLIMVLQFVGFLGAYRHPGGLAPLTAGLLGALITVWVTFVPCFLWIFLGAPYVEILRRQRGLSNALAAITAAVVGVIANLALWFSLHTLFGRLDEVRHGALRLLVPAWKTLDPAALGLAVAASLALLRWKIGMEKVLLGTTVLGMLWFLAR